jgi:DHA1 family bicyclomycin/chloramphenicol resistance-like MFS transporter
VIGAQVLLLAGWRANFVLLAVLALLFAGVVWRRLPETLRFPDPDALRPRRMLANYATLLRHRVYLGHLLGAGFVFSALFSFVTAGPFVFITRLGLSELAFSLLSVVTVAGFMAGSFSAARISTRIGLERMVMAGSAVTALSGLIMLGLLAAGFLSVPSLVLPMVGVVFGMGWVFPNTQAGAIAPFPHIAGSASAMLGFGQMGIAALVLSGLALVPSGGAWAMVVSIAVCGVLAFAVLAVLVWPSRPARR